MMRIALVLGVPLALATLMTGCTTSQLSIDRDKKAVADREVSEATALVRAGDYAGAQKKFESAESTYEFLGVSYGVRGGLAGIQAKYAEVLAVQGECAMASAVLANSVKIMLTDTSNDIRFSDEGRTGTAREFITGVFGIGQRKPCDVPGLDYRQAAREVFARFAGQAAEATARTDESRRQNIRAQEEARAEAARDRAETIASISAAASAVGSQRAAGTGAGSSQQAVATSTGQVGGDNCRCGPDYIPCWVKKSAGGNYKVSSANGWDNYTLFGTRGEVITTKGWQRGTNNCSAIVK